MNFKWLYYRFNYVWCFFIAAAMALAESASSQTFTLEDILCAPYPTELVAASKMDRIAWVVNESGIRNIWTAASPDFQPVQLTNYTEDDGQPVGSLRLTPDGSILVYVRGGNPNRIGEHPNPTSNPDGAEQAIWAVRTKGGEPWKLAPGNSPELSPSGDNVLFLREGQIFEMAIVPPDSEDGDTKELKPLFKVRGKMRSPRWSSDGTRIAFVSDRSDHNFIGIYDLKVYEIRWIAPSVDRDILPSWSPHGRRIAFIRTPGAKKHEQQNLTGSNPFAIGVADVTYWSSPILFIHGDDDRNVLFQQTTDLVQRLRERDVHVETLIFPDEVHGFLRYESWLRTYRAAADFFDRFLKSENPSDRVQFGEADRI